MFLINIGLFGYTAYVWMANTFLMVDFTAACFVQEHKRERRYDELSYLRGRYTDSFWLELVDFYSDENGVLYRPDGMTVEDGELRVLASYYFPKHWLNARFDDEGEERSYIATHVVARRILKDALKDGLPFTHYASELESSIVGKEGYPDDDDCAFVKDMIHVDGALAQARRAQAAKAEP